jgi:hypothetical protein
MPTSEGNGSPPTTPFGIHPTASFAPAGQPGYGTKITAEDQADGRRASASRYVLRAVGYHRVCWQDINVAFAGRDGKK